MNTLDEVIARLRARIDGARAALVVGIDGVIVAGAGEPEDPSIELLAASYADVLRSISAINREATLGAPTELVVTSSSATLLLRPLTAEHALLLALEPGALLGRARFEARMAAGRLLPELET